VAQNKGISRRGFIIGTAGAVGVVGLGLGLRNLSRKRAVEDAAVIADKTAVAAKPYGDWRDVYREKWVWDKVVRSSHFVNCWYQAHCSWNVYVKDGVVWREEQVAEYPQINPNLPDPNPRGCQKGCCYSERMYDPTRIRYPLKRVGERGSGKWKRISWDEANTELADQFLDVTTKYGGDRIVWDMGPLYTEGTMTAGHQRHAVLLDQTVLDMNTEIGDGHRGAAETFGKIGFERSADDYFYSDLIVIWGSNPIFTQIPNAHYLMESRYHGAKMICIAPDYSASAVHSDFWMPVRQGCDAALALGVAHVLIEEDWIDRDFIREQTDLPILVREDTQLLLRTSDLEAGGSDEELYFWDEAKGLTKVPRRSLALGGIKPVLEGSFDVSLADGTQAKVRTVFSKLRDQLADYTPEKASKLCETPPSLIRKLAKLFAEAKAAAIVTSSNIDKYYHGNLVKRAQALVFALTGNFGKKGSGFVAFPWLDHDGTEGFVREMFSMKDMMSSTALKIIGGMMVNTAKWKLDGYTDEMIVYENSRDIMKTGRMTSGALFWYIHGGLLEASEKLQEWDPDAKRSAQAYIDEALEKEWQTIWPKPGNDPKILGVIGSNTLRRIRCYPMLLKHLWPKLETIVTMDWRMTSTTMYSDYVLPVTAWYERDEHKWVTPLMPYIHSGEKAASYYEARSDWEIFSRLTERMDQRAKERGIDHYVDRWGDTRPLGNLYEKFSNNGKYGHNDEEKVAAALLDFASNLGGLKWETLKKKGFSRFESLGKGVVAIGGMTDIPPNDSITPFTKHVFDKVPYPTLSRRIQFYLDQELYVEFGETLPVHKPSPTAGGDYPLMLTGGHTRWSIHGNWRDDQLLLRQQRGEPLMLIGKEEAEKRGIRDGQQVRVYNDLDEFQIMAKVVPTLHRGQVMIYHAWENFQFKNGKGFQNLTPSPLNPLELAGGQFHLRPMAIALQPSHTDRDTRVEVEAI